MLKVMLFLLAFSPAVFAQEADTTEDTQDDGVDVSFSQEQIKAFATSAVKAATSKGVDISTLSEEDQDKMMADAAGDMVVDAAASAKDAIKAFRSGMQSMNKSCPKGKIVNIQTGACATKKEILAAYSSSGMSKAEYERNKKLLEIMLE